MRGLRRGITCLRLVAAAVAIRVISGGWVRLVAHRRGSGGDGRDIGRIRIVISVAAAIVSGIVSTRSRARMR
jgi:hypothetical protein